MRRRVLALAWHTEYEVGLLFQVREKNDWGLSVLVLYWVNHWSSFCLHQLGRGYLTRSESFNNISPNWVLLLLENCQTWDVVTKQFFALSNRVSHETQTILLFMMDMKTKCLNLNKLQITKYLPMEILQSFGSLKIYPIKLQLGFDFIKALFKSFLQPGPLPRLDSNRQLCLCLLVFQPRFGDCSDEHLV